MRMYISQPPRLGTANITLYAQTRGDANLPPLTRVAERKDCGEGLVTITFYATRNGDIPLWRAGKWDVDWDDEQGGDDAA